MAADKEEAKVTPAELRALLEKATPGPWRQGTGYQSNVVLPPFPGEWVGVSGNRLDVGDRILTGQTSNRGREEWEADAAAIVALVNLAPQLLALWEAAQKYRDLVLAGASESDQLEAWAWFDDSLAALEGKPE